MSVSGDTRVSVRLAAWHPPEPYKWPQLEPNGGIRTKEHKVLADVSVIQSLGENAETFTLRGDAYEEDISILRDLKNQTVELRHPIHSGEVLVSNVSATSTGGWDTIEGERYWVYTYTVELIEGA